MPFQSEAEFHDYHHSKNDGNYGTFFPFWDTIFGTNKNYLKYMEKKSSMEKAESNDTDTTIVSDNSSKPDTILEPERSPMKHRSSSPKIL